MFIQSIPTADHRVSDQLSRYEPLRFEAQPLGESRNGLLRGIAAALAISVPIWAGLIYLVTLVF